MAGSAGAALEKHSSLCLIIFLALVIDERVRERERETVSLDGDDRRTEIGGWCGP